MKRPIRLGLLLTVALALLGCAGPSYWHEPPAQYTEPGMTGVWQGMLRHRATEYTQFYPLSGPVRVRCAAYADQIRLEVDQQHLSGQLGAEPVVRFEAPLAADGQFYHRMDVRGDTWVWGGVALFSERPTLWIEGRLDPATGLGQGQISVGPGRDGLGCFGEFRVSRGGGPAPSEALGRPFRIQYWIDEPYRGEDIRRRHGRLWPHHFHRMSGY